MIYKKINSQSTSSKFVDSRFSAEVKSILSVTFRSLGAVTRSKVGLLRQQTHPVSSVPTPIFGSSNPKGAKSNTNASEGGSNVAESLKKTLALLDHSSSKYSGAKSDGYLSKSSSPTTPHKLRSSKINLCDNLCYSPISPMIMQAMVTDVSSIEEQLVNLAKTINGLTKYIQNQDDRIDKIVDRVEGLIDEKSSHVPGKSPEVYQTKNPVK